MSFEEYSIVIILFHKSAGWEMGFAERHQILGQLNPINPLYQQKLR